MPFWTFCELTAPSAIFVVRRRAGGRAWRSPTAPSAILPFSTAPAEIFGFPTELSASFAFVTAAVAEVGRLHLAVDDVGAEDGVGGVRATGGERDEQRRSPTMTLA